MYDNVNVVIGNLGDFIVDGLNLLSCDFFYFIIWSIRIECLNY